MNQRDTTYCPKTKAGLGERIIDGEAVIVNAEGGEILVLNECGAFIWQLLDGEHDLSSLIETVIAEFEVDRGTADADVREFIEDLEQRGALSD